MSLISEDNKGANGSGGGAGSHAPRLLAGGYSAWKPMTIAFLTSKGIENGDYAVTNARWQQLKTAADTWTAEEARMTEDRVLGLSQATGSDNKPVLLDAQVEADRKVIRAKLDRMNRAFYYLLYAMSDDLRTLVRSVPQGYAFGLWDFLEKRFQNTEIDNVADLHKRWNDVSMGVDESFDAYKARVDEVTTLLDHAKVCPAPSMYAYTLLDKLQPRYEQAVLALKASGKLKDASAVNWEEVTLFINSHERSKQRGAEASASLDNQAMAVVREERGMSYAKAVHPSSHTHVQHDDRRVQVGRDGGAGYRDQGRDQRRIRTLDDVQCFNCQQYGHMSRRCPLPRKDKDAYQSHDSHASGRREHAASSSSSGMNNRDDRSHSGRTGHVSFIQAESNRFAVLSDENDHELDVGDESGTKDEPCMTDARTKQKHAIAKRSHARSEKHDAGANGLAAVTSLSSKVTGMDIKASLTKHTWGMDSMASLHVCGNRHQFVSLKKCAPMRVNMADDGVVTVTQCGTVSIVVAAEDGNTVKFMIDDVYFHDRFSTNLLSWNVLRAKGWELHSTQTHTHVITPGGNKITLSTIGRLSTMQTVVHGHVYSVGGINTSDVHDLMRLHERLGHIGFDRMVAVIKSGATLDIGMMNVSSATLAEARQRVLECEACTLGKGHRTAFGHRGVDKGNAPGETLHMDTYQTTWFDAGRRYLEYGLIVTDPHSEYKWFARLHTKDEGAEHVMNIVRNAQTQHGGKVKRLYADGGTEFINHTLKAFCRENGIELHYPPARTQQLNGVAERAVRTVKDTTRALMLHAGMPLRFWHRAAQHSVYVWNRTRVAKSTGMTPFEAMYGRKPSVHHWGVFGCDAFLHVPKMQRGPLTAKMEPCIYLGHDHTQNSALVYVIRTVKIIATRDVLYRETSFMHAHSLGRGGLEDLKRLGESGPGEESDDDDGVNVKHDDKYAATPQGGKESHASHTKEPHVPAAVPAVLVQNQKKKVNFAKAHAHVQLHEESKEELNDSDEWQLERIMGKRVRDGREEFRIQWKNPSERTWEPVDDFEPTDELVIAYEASQRPASESPSESPHDASHVEHDLSSAHVAMSVIHDIHAHSDGMSYDHAHVVCAVTAGVGLLDQQTPDTYRDAMDRPDADKWSAAMDKEMESCAALDVWEYVPRAELPKGTNILPVKWVYKLKTDEHGNVTSHKARITPKGFKQQYGKDFFEVYAATGMYKTMRLGLSLAAKWDHELEQLDVPTAFLNADIDEDVYMEVPEGYRQGKEGMVCKLRKALYGLKQAPRNWYLLVCRFIVESMGFKACVSDPCLFYKRSRTGRLMLLFLFVDDFQVSYHREDRAEWNELKAKLVARFNTKDMGPSTWILGMRITRDRKARTITLDQELYVTKALERYGLTQCTAASTPEVVGQEAIANIDDATLDTPADKVRFMEITGTLMYAGGASRPDIAHASHQLASHMQSPTRRHMLAAERVLRYLSGTRDVGLVFGAHNGDTIGDSRGRRTQLQVDVCAYADADWANSKGDRRSITGWVAKLNGDTLSYASRKQRTVALSTCEAELYAEAAAIQEVLWLRGILKELGLRMNTGSIVHGDNQSAIAVSKNGIKGERTKHVDIKYHFITETVESGDVILKWIPTADMQADIFTKALSAPLFNHFRKQLMTR